jgi:hypothetical protein
MDWECPHCHQLFNFIKHQQKGAHITNCVANPKHADIGKAISEALTEPRIEIIKNCPKCGKTFSQFKRAREIETGKDIKEFCSQTCANSHEVSQSHKEKVSKTMKDKYERGELVIPNPKVGRSQKACIICGNFFDCLPADKQQTCGRKCGAQLFSLRVKGTGKMGGWRPKRNFMYGDIKLDSFWEVECARRLDALSIKWESSNIDRFFLYEDIYGINRRYYPDFYLIDHDLYIEVKGVWTPEVLHKMQDVQKRNSFQLIILDDINAIRSFNIPAS